MSLFGLVLIVGGLGFLCWLLFTLAIYALPFFVGLWAGFAALQCGAGYSGAFVVGSIAAAAVFALGKLAFANARSPLIRIAIGLIYAVPASIAGYQATFGLARIGTPSQGWCILFAIVGALAVGATAWHRVSGFTVVAAPCDKPRDPQSFRAAGVAKGG
jgi:hypothetical protein